MPPKLNVAGSVELSGHEVCLRLAPTSMSSASTSATVPTLSLLDKQPPSTMDIMAQIQQGTLVCHESRRGVSAQELGQRIHAIQAALALWPRGMQGSWSADAEDRLYQWMLSPKRGQKRSVAVDGVEDKPLRIASTPDCAVSRKKGQPELVELLEAIHCHQAIEEENETLKQENRNLLRLNDGLVTENNYLRRKLARRLSSSSSSSS